MTVKKIVEKLAKNFDLIVWGVAFVAITIFLINLPRIPVPPQGQHDHSTATLIDVYRTFDRYGDAEYYQVIKYRDGCTNEQEIRVSEYYMILEKIKE